MDYLKKQSVKRSSMSQGAESSLKLFTQEPIEIRIGKRPEPSHKNDSDREELQIEDQEKLDAIVKSAVQINELRSASQLSNVKRRKNSKSNSFS